MKLKTLIAAGALFAATAATAGRVTVSVGEAYAGMGSVTAVDKAFAAGAKVALKATAAKGYVFSGWDATNGVALALATDPRNPASTLTAPDADQDVFATFAPVSDDRLAFDLSLDLADFDANEEIDPIALDIDSVSLPTVTVTGLPAGLKFDAKTLIVSGKPTKPGVYAVTVSAKNAGGYQFSQIVDCRVGNLSSARVEGKDVEDFQLGEEADGYVDDVFSIEGAYKSIAVTGLPAGLKATPEKEGTNTYYRLSGTATKAGTYIVTAKVTFATDAGGNAKQTIETATMAWTVLPEDPEDYGVDFEGLEGLRAGVPVDASDAPVVGAYDAETKTGVTKVAGLPSGLSAAKNADGEWVVAGTPSKAGRFTVSATVAYLDDNEKIKTATVSQSVTVAASESVYVSADLYAGDEESDAAGTVSGAGVYAPGAKVTVKAVPAKGSVFAGWYDADGEAVSAGGDYRAAAQTFTLGASDVPVEWFARFATNEEDSEIALTVPADAEIDASSDAYLSDGVIAESLSAPTITFKGLPAGFTTYSEDGAVYVSYDPATAKAVPAPGVYTVTVTAVNASKATESDSFEIRVKNWTSAFIAVEDSYGPFDPGEAIEAMDFSGAVNFAGGETLAVAGLPKGLAWNAKANAAKGIEANTITGAPTVPGSHTVTFTAKVVAAVATNAQGRVTYTYATEKATATIVVNPLPELYVAVDETAAGAGCKVTGAGGYLPGTKVTLKATAAKGYVFAGWNGLDDDSPMAFLNPTLSCVTGSSDEDLEALFIPVKDDWLVIDEDRGAFGEETCKGLSFPLNETVSETKFIASLVDSGSLPTVALAGLPAGLKFDAKTLAISGKPTKSGVYYATLTAKNAGGYAFTSVLRFAVLNADGSEPEEAAAVKGAEDLPEPDWDFSRYERWITGVKNRMEWDFYENESGATATKVSVAGLPAGVSYEGYFRTPGWYDDESEQWVEADEDALCLHVSGVPTKPGRYTLTATVTYSDRTTVKYARTFLVYDGGSHYLDVQVLDEAQSLGTAAGAGVYAAGATVKLTAKAAAGNVFAGWFANDTYWDDEAGMYENDGFDVADFGEVDPRTATVSFSFGPGKFLDEDGASVVYAKFSPKADDGEVAISVYAANGVWNLVDLDEDAELCFEVESLSLPKVTAKGLPKGVSLYYDEYCDYCLEYDPSYAAAIAPGKYEVTITAVNLSGAKAVETVVIVVPNKTSEYIAADPDADAYTLTLGVSVGEAFEGVGIAEDYEGAGLTLSVAGLPAGVSYKNGEFSGSPTKAGNYTVTITAKSGSKTVGTATITVTVFDGKIAATIDLAEYAESEDVAQLVAAGIEYIDVAFGAKGALTCKAYAGKKAYTCTAQASVYRVDEDGVYYADAVVYLPTLGACGWIRMEFTPGEDGKVSSDGVALYVYGEAD